MIVDGITLAKEDTKHVLSARVRRENKDGAETTIRFELHGDGSAYLSEHGDPFLAALLLPSMALGERLEIEAPVSPVLLKNCEQIQAVYSQWYAGLRRIPIIAQSREALAPPFGGGTGCFFSCGVDSHYSLLKHRETITHLILIRGFDRALRDEEVRRLTTENVRRVAAAEGKELLLIDTEIRDYTDRVVAWKKYAGAVLGCVGLIYSRLFQTIFVPSGGTYLQLTPFSSHPLLDPLWSNGTTAFVHDGCEVSRARKVVDHICRSELALGNLRVCWGNKDSQYNCCRCEKCVRTMISLYAGGGLERCATFTKPIEVKAIRRLLYKGQDVLAYALENEKLLAEMRPSPRALRRALRGVIRRSRLLLMLNVLRGKRI